MAITLARGGRSRGRPRWIFAACVLLGVLTLAAGSAAAAGSGYKVDQAEFVVSVSDGEGSERTIQSDLVPYLPDRACFGWRVRLSDAPKVVHIREVLKLPEAPAFWSGEDDEYSTHTFSADRKTATTVEYKAARDGWIASNWCVVDGDPVGPHSIDVYIEDRFVRHFDFIVKRPGGTFSN